MSERADALLIPSAALFRDRDRWAVFVAEGSRARLRLIEVAESTAAHAAVAAGLEEGELVVLHPSDEVLDGSRVTTH